MTPRHRSTAYLLLVVPMLAAGLACSEVRDETDRSKVVVALIDGSLSTANREVRDIYCRNFRQALDAAGHGDVLVAGWITSHSAGELSLPVRVRLPAFEAGTNNPMMERELRQRADSSLRDTLATIEDRLCQLVQEGGKSGETDIMGSIRLANRIFDRYGDRQPYLLLMSDMIEDSERYSFDSVRMTDDRIQRVLQEERESGRLPALQGVQVYVWGATPEAESQADRIEEFWRNYFKASGADLVSYGGPMVDFP